MYVWEGDSERMGRRADVVLAMGCLACRRQSQRCDDDVEVCATRDFAKEEPRRADEENA